MHYISDERHRATFTVMPALVAGIPIHRQFDP
jgi:hypothetical protein